VSEYVPFLGQSAGHWQVMLTLGGGLQNPNAQYGDEFNRLVGGLYGTANDLDLTNRLNSLRWLTSMYS